MFSWHSHDRIGPEANIVLYDGGQDTHNPEADNGWAAAIVPFDGRKALGIRWNGDKARPQGNPSSHGQLTWFIVPKELEEAFLEIIKRFCRLDEPTGISLGMVASPQCPLPFRPAKSL